MGQKFPNFDKTLCLRIKNHVLYQGESQTFSYKAAGFVKHCQFAFGMGTCFCACKALTLTEI